jgi:creatinine amidohydrolase
VSEALYLFIMPMRSCFWHELTTTDFSEGLIDLEKSVAVLPLGAIEQHGPHLPLWTDTLVAESLSRLMLQQFQNVDDDDAVCGTVLVMPTISMGLSMEHSSYPGTLTLPYNVLVEQIVAVGACVAAAGIRKMVFLNAHGGNPPVLEIAALTLRKTYGMLVVKSTVLGYPLPNMENGEALCSSRDCKFGIHGGTLETSIIMHLRPDLVRMDRLEDFPSHDEQIVATNSILAAEGRPFARFAWLSEDLNAAGVCGEAQSANAEKGRLAVEHFVKILVTVVKEVLSVAVDELLKPVPHCAQPKNEK